MLWLCGASYAPFATIRRMHLRHHSEKADTTSFDHRTLLRRWPSVARAVMFAEWLYVPAVELLLHAYVVVSPFVVERRKPDRVHVLLVFTVRFAALCALGATGRWRALVLYSVAYCIMLHVLRFADCFQHTFDTLVLDANGQVPKDGKQRDRAYEQQNTYSNLFVDTALLTPLNFLLWLNFGFHNAHHDKVTVPFYDLPRAHAANPAYSTQTLPVTELVKDYHRDRVIRVLAPDNATSQQSGRPIGAVGVSFLTDVT